MGDQVHPALHEAMIKWLASGDDSPAASFIAGYKAGMQKALDRFVDLCRTTNVHTFAMLAREAEALSTATEDCAREEVDIMIDIMIRRATIGLDNNDDA